MRLALLLTAGLLLAGCSTPPAFQNRYTTFEPKGLGTVLHWRWQAWRAGLPPPPAAPTPQVEPDLAFIAANDGGRIAPAATWIGHATTLMQVGGLNLLTDPHFSERASPLSFAGPRRAQPPGLALAQLPHIHLVLISHDHYDHLDVASVRALAAQPGGSPLFAVPLGLKAWFEALGIPRVVELGWWKTHRLGDVEFTLTPVQHWSGRGLTDRLQTLWGGWAVLAPDFHLYYSGDTGYSRDFLDTREFFAPRQAEGGFDLALIAVGAYEPRWFMAAQHVNPEESLQVHLDLGARRSIGLHWGTFELTDEALDEPPRALAAARAARGVPEARFGLLAIGETRRFPRRGTEPGPR